MKDIKTLSISDIDRLLDWECQHLILQCQMPPGVQEQYKGYMRQAARCLAFGRDIEILVPENMEPIYVSLDKDIIKKDNENKSEESSSSNRD